MWITNKGKNAVKCMIEIIPVFFIKTLDTNVYRWYNKYNERGKTKEKKAKRKIKKIAKIHWQSEKYMV